MSTCISRHGEFGSHELDDLHTCTLCHVLDEDALRAELSRLRAAEPPAGSLVVTIGSPLYIAGGGRHRVVGIGDDGADTHVIFVNPEPFPGDTR